MLPLLVRISHTESGVQRDVGFRRSPVRIGRNHLNDLALDEPFVSQWHGIVRFDDEGTRFLDVGSTNGTVLEDARLEKNTEVEVTDQTTLVIGPLTLSFVRMPLDDSQILSRRASAFSLGGTKDPGAGHAASGTMLLSDKSGPGVAAPGGLIAPPTDEPALVGAPTLFERSGPDASPPGAPAMASPPGAPARVGGEGSAAFAGIGETAKRMAGAMKELTLLYEKHEASRVELEAGLRKAIEEASSDAEKRGYRSTMRDAFPRAIDHREIRVLLDAPVASGGVDAESWLTRLVGPANTAALGDTQSAMERAGALLEAFATAYVDLIGGQQQVISQLSVESGGEGSPLHEIADPRALLTFLLDGSADGQGRLDELADAFADIVVHQLGILNGVVDGARALMLQLSPHAIGAVAPGTIARTSPSLGDYLWPFRAAGQYYRYAARHMELSGEKQLTKIIFGGSFSKAYYRVTGARGGARIPSRLSR